MLILILINLISAADPYGVSQSESIKSKFEPWLWDKVQELEANGTTRFMVIGVRIDCELYRHNVPAAYNFKTQVATLLTQEHNATILYIGKILSFVNIEVRVPEIKKIASYKFVELLSDGEAEVSTKLDVSTVAIRSSVVSNEVGYNGSGVKVAILDTGLYASHLDFEGKNVTWKDFINNQTDPYDDNGHGTHCSGIAVGTEKASNEKYKGVAPGVTTLLVGKMLDQNGFGPESISREALDWAVSEGAQVISCSWGIQRDCNGQCGLCRTADECVSNGVIVVAAAGNDGPDVRTIICPGTAFNVITVGAIDDRNTKHICDDTLPSFSSRGPTADQRPKPDLVAPGWNIVSPDRNGGYSGFSYTSAATPHVAGVAALILQAHPTWTPDMVKYAIKDTARLNDQLVWPAPLHLPEWDRGTGIVDAYRAVSLRGLNIPADQAETNYTSGNGTYTANAYLNGTYEISAGSLNYDKEGYAIATLNKTFTQEYNSANPRFLFTFHDEGYMIAYQEPAELNATFKLFAPDGTLLLTSNQQIHSISQGYDKYYDDYHTIKYTYLGTLHAQQTYKIEYGFSTYAPLSAFTAFEGEGGRIVAEWLSTIDGAIFGAGNPSFEERLLFSSVYNVSYWWSNNLGWRNVRGDLDFDGDCDSDDRFIFMNAYLYEYDWHADFDGDGDVDSDDWWTFRHSYIYDTPNYLDGIYSWYTSGGGNYTISQWLCDYDANAMKGHEIMFRFRFKPETVVPNVTRARAEVHYVLADGTSQTIANDWEYPTQIQWYNPSIWVTIPADTIAIKLIIHGEPDFKAWIDSTFMIVI